MSINTKMRPLNDWIAVKSQTMLETKKGKTKNTIAINVIKMMFMAALMLLMGILSLPHAQAQQNFNNGGLNTCSVITDSHLLPMSTCYGYLNGSPTFFTQQPSTGSATLNFDNFLGPIGHTPAPISIGPTGSVGIPSIMVNVTAPPYNADSTGATDSSAAFNLAALTGKNIWVPSGKYYWKFAVNIKNQGLYCADLPSVTIRVLTDFDSTASGVINLFGRENQSPSIFNCNIVASQPTPFTTTSTQTVTSGTTVTVAAVTGSGGGINIGSYIYDNTHKSGIPLFTTVTNVVGNTITLSNTITSIVNSDTLSFNATRAQAVSLGSCTTNPGAGLCKYPPIINYNTGTPSLCNGANRVVLDNIILSGAWDGVNACGGGGTKIRHMQIGAIDYGIYVDNAQDLVAISDVECWPFGHNGGVYTETNYADGQNWCLKLGRVDGLAAEGITAFENGITSVSSTFGVSEDPWSFTSTVLDGSIMSFSQNGPRINFSGGSIFMPSNLPFAGLSITNAKFYVSAFEFIVSSTITSVPPIVVGSSGGIICSSCNFEQDGFSAPAIDISGNGQLFLANTAIIGHNLGTSANTGGYIVKESSNGILSLGPNVSFSADIPGVGVNIQAYNASDYVSCEVLWLSNTFLQPGGVAGPINCAILYNTAGTTTYYPTPGTASIHAYAMGSGGGGGGGALTAAGTQASGGAGGGGGSYKEGFVDFTTSNPSSGLTVQIGAGGAGGAAATSNSTAGGDGSLGNLSALASVAYAYGGGGGAGGRINNTSGGGGGGGYQNRAVTGTTSGGAGGDFAGAGGSGVAANNATFEALGTGGGGSSAAGVAGAGGLSVKGGPGGAAGGGVTAGSGSNNGAAGTCSYYFGGSGGTLSLAGGTSGTPNGASGASVSGTYKTGCSGGGGYGNGAGVAGSPGASGPGAGGSGGGSALNGSTAQAGAKGGDGFVYILETQ
jgi:hypothetical protein